MNYAFYVSGNAGRLRKIIEKNENYLKKIKLIISDCEKNIDLKAGVEQRFGIDYILLDYKKMHGDKNLCLSDQMLTLLKKYNIDYIFCFGDHILKGDLLKFYENRIVNFHPSLLPMFKGRNAIDQAIAKNAFLLGCTAHFVDAGMDTGPVIMQCVMSSEVFGENDYDAVLDTQLDMLRTIVTLIEENRIIITDKRVIILNADYKQTVFFPQIL